MGRAGLYRGAGTALADWSRLEPIPPAHAHGTVTDHRELLLAQGAPPASQGQQPDRCGVGATTAPCVMGPGAPRRSRQYSPCGEL